MFIISIGMLNDLSIGEDHAQQFKDYCIEKRSEVFGPSKMDFSVQVSLFINIYFQLYNILFYYN